MKAYLVGGAVRDQLLGLDVVDRDYVVVGATGQELLDLGYKAVGADFPVFLHPNTSEEYALARTERKTGKGYKGFECNSTSSVTLEEDLLRRDLTINAMAQDEKGCLVDPYGGQADLRQKYLHHVSDAFNEDPLRVLRVARFYARFASLGFRIHPSTLKLIEQMVISGELEHLVPERIFKEFEKALLTKHPELFLRSLHEVKALKTLMPEMETLYASPDAPFENVLAHALDMKLELREKFAIICMYLAKDDELEKREKTLLALCDRLKVPKAFKKLALGGLRYGANALKGLELDEHEIFHLLRGMDALRRPEDFSSFLKICEAVYRSKETGKPFKAGQFLRDILTAVKALDIKKVISELDDSGGLQIQAAIEQSYLKKIAEMTKKPD